MRNVILLALVLVVVAVTALNSYTTKLNCQYFMDATLQSNRESAREQWVCKAQDAVGYAQETVRDEAKLSLGFREERDTAIRAYYHMYDQAVGMYQTMRDMEAYIQTLIKFLGTYGLEPPKAELNTFPPSDWECPQRQDFGPCPPDPKKSTSSLHTTSYTVCHMVPGGETKAEKAARANQERKWLDEHPGQCLWTDIDLFPNEHGIPMQIEYQYID